MDQAKVAARCGSCMSPVSEPHDPRCPQDDTEHFRLVGENTRLKRENEELRHFLMGGLPWPLW